MQYSPKLKKAMEEIKAIIKKNDIAGFVVLHEEGFSEYINQISPSYSCAIVNEEGNIRFRLKTAEVGMENAKKIAEATFNMVTHFADVVGRHALFYIESQKILKEKWDGFEFPGNESSNTQQNN